MRSPRSPSTLTAVKRLAAIALGGGACAIYVMACSRPLTSPAALATLTITTTSPLPGGTVGVPFTVPAPGGDVTFVFQATVDNADDNWWHPTGLASSDTLPTGLTLNSEFGTLTGIPMAAGTCTFTVRLDNDGLHASKTFTITITAPGTLEITTPAVLPGGTVGALYDGSNSGLNFGVSGGVPNEYGYIWSHLDNKATGDTLPTGLSLRFGNGFVQLAGTPVSAGICTFTLTVTDYAQPNAHSSSQSFTIIITPSPITITTLSPLPGGAVGAVYDGSGSGLQFNATGGFLPFTWSHTDNKATGDTLPTGLVLSAGGALTGIPISSGSSTFTVHVADHTNPNPITGVGTFTITIAAAGPPLVITTTSLAAGTVGLPYNNPLMATGGIGTYVWSVTSGSVPPGLALNSDGTWAGVPTTTAGSPFTFTLQVTSGPGVSATQAYSVTIQPGCSITPSGTVTGGTVGIAYNLGLAAGGTCTLPGNWGIAKSPPGLSLAGQVVASTTETLEGTPTTAGRYLFTIGFSDAGGMTTAFDTILVQPAPNTCAIVPVAVPDGTVGAAYGDGTNNVLTATSECTAASNPAQWTWSIAGAPSGLSLVQGPSQTVPTATLQGTPTTTNSPNPYTLVVTFRNGPSDPGVTQSYTININPGLGTSRVRATPRAPAAGGRPR